MNSERTDKSGMNTCFKCSVNVENTHYLENKKQIEGIKWSKLNENDKLTTREGEEKNGEK